ncbi:hypothetical protein PR202_ga07316 [Eleusine coracana subsp. coracana]|uniref:MSP domain-containing protein n=1 Tax=Eleusine coracana subsp. coracana TaxID=191504 RepID=A0AAV5BZL8_ELECO|nr:hypothetical protein PR202_ga07316 [Eleusine coracana subsp. coracana]
MEFLQFDRQEVSFVFEANKKLSCLLKLTNKTDSYIAFNWKVTDHKNYSFLPNKGILLPRLICTTVITKRELEKPPPDLACNDKVLLQSTKVIESFTKNDIDMETFRKETGKVVNEVKLKVVLLLSD